LIAIDPKFLRWNDIFLNLNLEFGRFLDGERPLSGGYKDCDFLAWFCFLRIDRNNARRRFVWWGGTGKLSYCGSAE
jgi:hypothetical protein